MGSQTHQYVLWDNPSEHLYASFLAYPNAWLQTCNLERKNICWDCTSIYQPWMAPWCGVGRGGRANMSQDPCEHWCLFSLRSHLRSLDSWMSCAWVYHCIAYFHSGVVPGSDQQITIMWLCVHPSSESWQFKSPNLGGFCPSRKIGT